ncbi:MAG: hypothetical protein R2701_05850 [Acidimicrobiales bacterium]
MIELYRENLARTGRTLVDPASLQQIVGSTDMGNVSHVVPSIHPMIMCRHPRCPIHTEDFVRFAGGEEGDRGRARRRPVMATVVDLWAPGRPRGRQGGRCSGHGRATGSAVVDSSSGA